MATSTLQGVSEKNAQNFVRGKFRQKIKNMLTI